MELFATVRFRLRLEPVQQEFAVPLRALLLIRAQVVDVQDSSAEKHFHIPITGYGPDDSLVVCRRQPVPVGLLHPLHGRQVVVRRQLGPELAHDLASSQYLLVGSDLLNQAHPSSCACAFSLASTVGSASVVVSPRMRPSAISRNRRRMILALRVLGSSAVKKISSGLAIEPIFTDT